MKSNAVKIRCKQGFTLIELLVVVLIIGILAAVALPQYQKAVRKSRLSAVHGMLNAIGKGIDMYLLENGYPEKGSVSFFGPYKTANLGIDIPTAGGIGYYGFTEYGSVNASCAVNSCSIMLFSGDSIDGTPNVNNWLGKNELGWVKRGEGAWKLWSMSPGNKFNREVCSWWISLYGTDGIDTGSWADDFCNN